MPPARIMVAEDERTTVEDIHDILSQLGYTVTAVVSSGQDALREAERTKPDWDIGSFRTKSSVKE